MNKLRKDKSPDLLSAKRNNTKSPLRINPILTTMNNNYHTQITNMTNNITQTNITQTTQIPGKSAIAKNFNINKTSLLKNLSKNTIQKPIKNPNIDEKSTRNHQSNFSNNLSGYSNVSNISGMTLNRNVNVLNNIGNGLNTFYPITPRNKSNTQRK